MTIKNNKGKDLTISWSGYETFNDCPRKWYYGYMDRIRTSSQATEVGSNVHDMAEDYLNGKLDLDNIPTDQLRWFRILQPGLVYAPTPEEIVEEGWGVEDWLKMQCGPLPFVGKVDFYNIEQRKVCDWKTTGFKDFRYSKSPSALAKHGQPLVYSYALFHEDPPATLDFQHINLLTKGKPDAMESWAYEVPWTAAEVQWREMEMVAKQMAAVATNHPTADTVTPQPGACRKFGGCPHAEYCLASPKNFNKNLKPTPRKEPLMANSPGTNDRLARLRAKLGVQATPAPGAEAPPPPAPTPTGGDGGLALATTQARQMLDSLGKVPEPVMKMLASTNGVQPFEVTEALSLRLKDGDFVPKPAPEPEPAKPTKVHLEPGMAAKDALLLIGEAGLTEKGQFAANQLKNVGGILVPTSFKGGVTEAYQKYRPGTPEAKVAETIDEVDASLPASPAPSAGTNAGAAQHLIKKLKAAGGSAYKSKATDWVKEVLDLKRIRQARWDEIVTASGGRLSWEGGQLWLDSLEPDIQELVDKYPEAAAKDMMQQLAEVEPGPEPTVTAAAEPVIKGVDDLPPEIFVDAYPLNDDYMDFSEWIHPWELEVAAENGVPYYGLVGYGQGPKQVVSKVMAAVHAQGTDALPDCTMVVDSFHPLAAEVIPVLNRIPGVRWVKGRR